MEATGGGHPPSKPPESGRLPGRGDQESALPDDDVRWTYLYLRIGILGAAALLAAAIVIEFINAGYCLQNSISAYYYTPVRSIFVGFLIAMGHTLIVYKAEEALEDFLLNLAGMLAPVVAVAPTTFDSRAVARCIHVPPGVPSDEWLRASIDNNFIALLMAGVIGLAASVLLNLRKNDRAPGADTERAKRARHALGVTAVVLLIGWLAIKRWDRFYELAHGYAAVLTFICLGGAILTVGAKPLYRSWREQQRKEEGLGWPWAFVGLAGLMLLGGILIPVLEIGGDQSIFWLELWEIALFATYWVLQTIEREERERRRGTGGGGQVIAA
jgi:hypothetical protein